MGERSVVGRQVELDEVARLLDALAEGPAGLVLEGEAGIGKSTIWEAGIDAAEARGVRVLACRPAEPETSLAYAGVADLLGSAPASVRTGLPEPQRGALAAALLEERAPERGFDQRAVAAAVLAVVRLLAEERPLLVAVDDVQWLDVSSVVVLGFALRRLRGERVGLLAAVRADAGATRPLDRVLPAGRRIVVGPLSVGALHSLFKLRLGRSFARPTLVHVAQVSGGNPFYALEIARELERDPRPRGEVPLPADLSNLVEARIGWLPAATRKALLAVAALGQPSLELVDAEALEPAEEAGIVRVDEGRVRFSHPIYASVVYGKAGEAARRGLHRRLAAAVADAEERARHLALGAEGEDADVAESLEAAARQAAARGATSAAAGLAGLALRLTPESELEERARRGSVLGNLFHLAGDLSAAIAALKAVRDETPPGPARSAALVDLGGMYTLVGEHARGVSLIDEALAAIEDPLLAARAHARRAWTSARDPDLVIAHCRAALELIDEDQAPGLYSFALQYLACGLLFGGHSAAHDLIERSLPGQQAADVWTIGTFGQSWPHYFEDVETTRARREEALARAEAEGNESERQAVLAHTALLELWTGHPLEARSLAAEALELAEQIEQPPMACVARYSLGLAEVQLGHLDTARALATTSLKWMGSPPDDAAFVLATQAYAVLGSAALAEGSFDEADHWFSLADEACSCWREPAPFRFHGDHAEVAIALGQLERAEGLVQRLERRADAIPRPWTSAISARCRGLLQAVRGDLDGALAAVEQALDHHERLAMPLERARTLLALGVIQRRRKQKRLAREALSEARALFEAVAAPLWLARAEEELRRVATRSAGADLTATEQQIARLAASGLTNRAIAERVFVTTKTVEANLARAYRKLGIGSRAQLARALDARDRLTAIP